MKLKFNSFLFVLALGCSFSMNAQENHFNCGHNKRTQEMWAQDPQMKADYDQLVANARQNKGTGAQAKTTYIIPLVFHIIHEYGTENILDSQVYDQVAVLNRDYRKQNTDISELVAGYDTLAADVNIEFRLATIDPYGNCTNGIEHIYSHETNNGDDYAKHNQWQRSRYLNVWVVKSMRDGVAGYAYYPTATEGSFFFADGIIILNGYIGRIGTSNENSSRALTHEIGHYLGLAHPWGNTNDPGVACGDDGIDDTPETKGFNFCPQTLAQATICNPPVVENYQNYMDYSYCSVMFSKDQADFMRNTLIVETANRSNLWKDTNLMVTGALANPAPLCTPVADFSVSTKFACEGDAVTFKDVSWNAAVDSRVWYFTDGTPSTSTSATPSVTFSGIGWKKVKLVVTNATGTDSTVRWETIHISQNWADKVGPYTEDFESGNVVSWLIDNPEDNYAEWQLSNTNGKGNSKCMKLNNYRDVSNAQMFTDTYFYNFRLGGNKDGLITPSYDLSTTTGSELIFDYAYATNGATLADITESLKIYVSKNCGRTWLLKETLATTDLLSAGNSTGIDFKPTTDNLWKTATVSVPGNSTDTRTRFKFEFVSSDVSNNVYIDNIRVTGVLSIAENPLNAMDITVYPNPTNSNNGISINYVANENPVEFQLMDLQGKVITTETNKSMNSEVTHKLELSSPLASGCYYLKVSQGAFNMTKKVVIL
jgi:PKD repeat protein